MTPGNDQKWRERRKGGKEWGGKEEGRGDEEGAEKLFESEVWRREGKAVKVRFEEAMTGGDGGTGSGEWRAEASR